MEHKRFALKSVPVVIALCLIISGCAAERQLVKSDLKTIDSVKLVRHSAPSLLKDTRSSASVALAGVFLGSAGSAIAQETRLGMMKASGLKAEKQYNLPDFSELVIKRLNERIPKEISDWPKMTMSVSPAGPDAYGESGNTLLVHVVWLRVRVVGGFEAEVTGQLYNKRKDVLWRKSFRYFSGDFNRSADIEQLEADNGKLLKDEYAFAADKIATIFIKDLRGELPKETQIAGDSAAWKDK